MIVNPGIRRFLGSAIQRLFNSASFVAPLTHTAVPTRAASGTTATFTRATTSTWPNNDGYMVTGVAGEIGFVGARRVRNLLTYSEDLSNAIWTKNSASITGTTQIVEAAANAQHYILQAANFTSGKVYILQGKVKSNGRRYCVLNLSISAFPAATSVFFDLQLGTLTSTGAGAASGTISSADSNGFYTITIKATANATASANAALYLSSAQDSTAAYLGDGASGIYAKDFQLEDVTAQTTQTAGEYVSVGVESAPYYHGSMVDGVKCYATDINGSPIPSSTLLGYQAQGARTNLCLQSNAFTTTWTLDGLTPVQDAIGPDGATSAWTFTDNSAVAGERTYQSAPPLTAAAYTLSVFIKKTTGAQTGYPVIDFYPTAGTANFAGMTVDTTNGIATAWTARTGFTMASGISANCVSYNDSFWRVSLTVTGTASNYYVVLYPAGTTNPTQSTGALDATAQGSAVFYGAQVELGSFASSYIATTTLAVARNADVLTYSSAGNIDGTKGWCYAEAGNTPNKASLRQPILATYPSGNGLILNNYTATDPASVEFYDGSAFRTGQTYTQSVAAQKFAASWGTGVRTAVGGSVTAQLTFDGDAAVGTVFAVGNYTDGTNGWFGTIRNVRIGQRQLSSSELQAVTR